MALGGRGRYVEAMWPGNSTAQTRRERIGGKYRFYLPEPIADEDGTLPASLVSAVTEADQAVAALNRLEPSRANRIEALARQLLRQESLASSRIEGLSLSHKRIARVAYDPRGSDDDRARAVLSNIEAMAEAVEVAAARTTISKKTILDLHKTLLRSTEPKIAGRLRKRQSWIGGSWVSPVGAEFVPPPHEQVDPLLRDLAAFMNRTDLPATLQAAIAHAQFETIHPFADGNGRVGRCLIHVVFRRRGVAPHHVPPVSLVMATEVDNYVRALTAYRTGRPEEWTTYFARTTVTAALEAERFARELDMLQDTWRDQARVRSGSTAAHIIDLLPAQPLIDIPTAAKLTGNSPEAARLALNGLAAKGVVRQVTERNWGRVWEAQGLYSLIDRFEERLATPTGGANAARPAPKTPRSG